MFQHQRRKVVADEAGGLTNALVERGAVGVTGLEPVTSSL
jgi:hypothetical protein